jgi:hypothetical protein
MLGRQGRIKQIKYWEGEMMMQGPREYALYPRISKGIEIKNTFAHYCVQPCCNLVLLLNNTNKTLTNDHTFYLFSISIFISVFIILVLL